MRKPLQLTLAASALAAAVVAAVLLVGRSPAITTGAPAAPLLSAYADNMSLISDLKDERVFRDRQLRMDGAAVEGDGVSMPAPGVLEFTSFNGVKLSQRVTGAALVAGQERRALARSSTSPIAGGDAKTSSVRFDGFFEGLDLEYRYDGRDVEEFFHVSDALKARVASGGNDVELTAVFPGLTREKSYVRPSAPPQAPGPEQLAGGVPPPPPDTRAPHNRHVEGTGSVELYADLGRFVLPPAIARDDAGHEQLLTRRFEYTDDGLEVRVRVPAEWVKEATGRVVIDPSIIDSNRQIAITGWSSYGYSLVRTSNNNLHVVYAAVYNGRWSIAYSRSTNNGVSWTQPALAFEGDSTIFDVQPPTIAVDANDTIHAVWATYGQLGSDSGTVAGSYAMLMHYARCANGCAVPNWQFQGERGGKLLTPDIGARTYQYNSHLAIDRDNRAHITFMNCSSFCSTQYLTISSDEIVDNSRPPPTDDWSYALFIDAQNVPEVFTINWFCDNRGCGGYIINLSYSESLSDWVRSPATQPTFGSLFANSGCNQNYGWAYNIAGSVGPDGNIHLVTSMYTGCSYGYFPAYVKFDPVNKVFSEATFVEPPASANGYWVWTNSVVTVDKNNVPYVVWGEHSSRNNIFLAHKNPGETSFTTREQLVRSTNASDPKVLCSKYWPASMRGVDGSHLDTVIVFGGNQLQYLSTGAPLDAPTAIAPRNGTYLANAHPTFSWQRLRTDDGSGRTTYTLELDDRPSFDSPSHFTQAVGSAVSANYAGPALGDGRCYYWRLTAANAVGTGPAGDPLELCVDLTAPAGFQNVSPADGSDPATRTPRFQWSVAAD
jgi:hypothetical protein